ncbi:hypothetical protein GCT13_24985 [Paraburkholderia sp. CNPSo 3157]|uniref:Replication protein O n=1 Tax=Paraburkholderia franconis TaxID=2654983 RepID=A0A7X1NDP3_9BURK|nr:hypothetical protein [Paraburkholderia franconis]MPW20057.1 hypothetical protein [Paraburkholderia franconis]
MSIAQQLVAGEGNAYPFKTDTLSTDAVNLPWVILRAVHQASRLDGIPTRARAVLAALARTVDAANPYGQIFARRELLTERAMQSERTFYRSLTDLEAAGLIERPAQRRYVQAGLFGRAYLHLTERAAILLGLVEAPAEKAADPAPAEGFTPPTATVADGAICKDLSPTAFQKRQPGQVPVDLQRLRPLGFRDFLIFRLMREARAQGKRLSDVVEATWSHLRQAKRPICYLRKLLASPTDFGHQVRARAAEHAQADAARCERKAALNTIRKLDGATFVDATGERRYTVEEGGAMLAVYSIEEGVARRDAGDWAVRFVRALHTGQIRPATQGDVEAFGQARRHAAVSARPHVDVPRVATEAISDHLALLRGALRRFAPGLARVI